MDEKKAQILVKELAAFRVLLKKKSLDIGLLKKQLADLKWQNANLRAENKGLTEKARKAENYFANDFNKLGKDNAKPAD